jgi:tRNA pseudouridine65 synthase
MINILFEDEYYIIVDKPPNLLVHRSKESNEEENLLKQVRNQIDQYVYPVHRLDRQVSGAIIFSKSPESLTALQKNWHDESFKKIYLGLSRGLFKAPGIFNFSLNDHNKNPKDALTLYRPINRYKSATLLAIQIKTGRHHQIRRHFARSVDHLLGDRKYGKKKYNDFYLDQFGLERVFLHSSHIEFNHPYTQKRCIIKCPMAKDLQLTLCLMAKDFVETIEKKDYINCYEL